MEAQQNHHQREDHYYSSQ